MAEQAQREFLEYDWSASSSWQQYYNNLYPTPSSIQLNNFKRKWFKKNVNSSLELDISTKSQKHDQIPYQNTGSYSNNRNESLNASGHKHWMILSFSISLLLTVVVLIFSFLHFVINARLTLRTIQLCTLSYVIGFLIYLYDISNKPIKFFTMDFWQKIIVEDSFHSLILLIAYYNLLNSFPMIYFIPGVTVLFIISNYKPVLQNEQIVYIFNLAKQNKNFIYQRRAFFEVIVLGIYIIIGIITRRISIIYISLYWSLIKAKYSFDPYIQYAFRITNVRINEFFRTYSNYIPAFFPNCYKWVS